MKPQKAIPVVGGIVSIVAVCFSLSSFRCSTHSHHPGKPPSAVKGVIDLSSWDFQTQGSLRLDGEWDFYRGKLLAPAEILSGMTPNSKQYITLPGPWKHPQRVSKTSASGGSTYSLRLIGLDPHTPLALAIPEIRNFYLIWLDTAEVASNWTASSNKPDATPLCRPLTVTVFPRESEAQLIVRVAHFYGGDDGIPRSILVGTQEQIVHRTVVHHAFNIFLIGALLVISLYYVALYAMGKKEPGLLLLGILGAIVITKALTVGDRLLLQFFPHFPWNVMLKIETVPMCLGVAFYTNFFYTLYPEEIKRRVFMFFFWISIGLGGLLVVLPVQGVLAVQPVTFYLRSIAALWGMYALVLAIIHKRDGAIVIALGFFFQLCTIIHDTLNEHNIIQSVYLVHAGLILFSVFAGGVITRRLIKTEQYARERQDQLAHIEKLAALGTVVAGVAHEINNPNSTIQLDAQTQQKALSTLFGVLKEQPPRREIKIGGYTYDELKNDLLSSAERMIRNSQRISRIVSNLRALGRKEVPMNEDIDLNATVVSALGVVDHVVKRSTRTLNLNLAQGIPIVKGNRQHLEQVVINLVRNACQALEDMDQAVTISTAFDAAQRMVTLTVTDEGAGMDEETRRNALTPYFTTKGGEGTGLGLPICKNIVTLHRGSISIESARGGGTTIRVALPVTPAHV
ncbi:MAG: hypothetical protein JW913_14885 [Chitinispirillaceae bacterium]|nr:hypothetical protein [Chitinispirillaceae bacterium]